MLITLSLFKYPQVATLTNNIPFMYPSGLFIFYIPPLFNVEYL